MRTTKNTWRRPVLALALAALSGAALGAEPAAAGADDTEKKLQEAQQRLDAAVRDVAELSGQLGRRFTMRIGDEAGPGFVPTRALIGVNISSEGNREGANVMNVSPGGPAAEAGIRQGDVIVSLAGHDLTKDSNPGRALVERLRDLEPGTKVQVTVLRDGKRHNFEVTPRPAPQVAALGSMAAMRASAEAQRGRAEEMRGRAEVMRERADVIRERAEVFRAAQGPDVRMFNLPVPPPGAGVGGPAEIRQFVLERNDEIGTRFRGMEFATLSEKLGGYFGVKAGVLVVRAGASSPFKLQDGDVILAIDGREATTAQHAGRILRSYQTGEKLTLRVQRDRKAQNLEVTAPGGRDVD